MERTRRILLGVTGGIAAFKAAAIVRLLRENGCAVRCMLTEAAQAFVTPLTLEILSGSPVYREEYLEAGVGGEELHLTAATWADCLVVAPATAHTLARLSHGLADDFLTTTALTCDCPLVLAPAMHTQMWSKPAVRTSVLCRWKIPAILALGGTGGLEGRRILVTAGPTHEAMDPVRYLANRSSGKMGFALAAAAAGAGAETVLVSGPVALATPSGVERIDVVSAVDMRDVVYEQAPRCDAVIMAAAVSDFRPRDPKSHKIKKDQGLESVELEPNPDILAGLREVAPGALIVGFAAETRDLEKAARGKLTAKRADLLVANDVSRPDVGFDSDDNEVTVLFRDRQSLALARQPKRRLAVKLMQIVREELDHVGPQSEPATR